MLTIVKPATIFLGCDFLTTAELAAFPAALEKRVLGVIAFGVKPPFIPEYPFAHIDMPLVTGGTILEVWSSDKPVQQENEAGISASYDGDFLFGYVSVEENGSLEIVTQNAYNRIFDFIDSRGYAHLLRIWNYFPRINEEEDNLERYRRFSIGRHEAFVAKGRDAAMENAPAACALGTQSGPLIIYFIATKKPGQPVENPRQTSAYNYPAQYGPCSPSFSRAMITQYIQESLLFISGTASIVGHTTVHFGNPGAQSRETIANLGAVIDHAAMINRALANKKYHLLLKVYLRRSEYFSVVESQLKVAFGPMTQIIYLEADICRSDLLLEVEGLSIYP